MFDWVRWLRQVGAAVSSTFAGTWAAVASLAAVFEADLAAGEQALTAFAASVVAAASVAVGNWIRQIRERR